MSALQQLAKLAGLETSYHDIYGNYRAILR